MSASGGPQLLYRVDAEGRAVPFAPAARQVTSNTGPGRFVSKPGRHAGRFPAVRASRCLRRRRHGCPGQRRHRRGDPAGDAGRDAIRPGSLVRAIRHSVRFDGTRTSWLRSRWSGHRGQRSRFARGLPPAGGYLGQVRQRGNQPGIHPRRQGGDALRQGRLHFLGGVRIHRSQAGRVARLFIGDYPGCPDVHVGACCCADVLPRRALRRVLPRALRCVLARTTAAPAGRRRPWQRCWPRAVRTELR